MSEILIEKTNLERPKFLLNSELSGLFKGITHPELIKDKYYEAINPDGTPRFLGKLIEKYPTMNSNDFKFIFSNNGIEKTFILPQQTAFIEDTSPHEVIKVKFDVYTPRKGGRRKLGSKRRTKRHTKRKRRKTRSSRFSFF